MELKALILLSCFAFCAEAQDIAGSAQDIAGSVVTLTQGNFDDFIKENNPTLVKFYAPWCGHCKAIAPEYEKAAKSLAGKILIGEVDATVETELGQRFGISGYPTLKWFVEGEAKDYDGGRTADGIISWINTETSDPVHVVEGEEVIEPPVSSVANVILHGPEFSKDYESVARAERKTAKFYYVKDNNLKLQIHHREETPIEFPNLTTTLLTHTTIQAFVRENDLPMFGNLDGDTFATYTESGKGLVWSLFPLESSDKLQETADANREMMNAVAKEFKGKYAVTYTDVIKFKDAIKGMLDITEFPKIAVHKKAGDKKKYIYDGEMTAENIIQFINDVESGKIDAILKSEEIPEGDQSDRNVIQVVGKTVLDIVYDTNKDVLLEVYAPWCGHCKKLDPEYEKVGKKVKKEQLTDIMAITKMDGTANDSPVEEISWTGFPTIVFVNKANVVKTFNGERTAKGIWKWLKENATDPEEIKNRVAKNKEERSGGDDADSPDGTKEEL